MNEIIFSEARALGRVKDYPIWYEVQHRGSLHAYIILWIQDDDVEWITNEITTVVPAAYDNKKEEFIEQTDDLQKTLFSMVRRKQLHSYGECCYHKHKYGECKYSFPFSVHENDKAMFNARNTRWEYHRPQYIDRNIVPYHVVLLLLWEAHLNL
jgi:uncharacterized protein YlbG (UPF0298 family)